VLIGNNLVNTASTALAETFLNDKLANVFSPPVSAAFTVVCMTLLLLLAGEITPKTIALARPEPLAMSASRPILWLTFAFRPLILLLEAVFALIERMIGLSEGQRRRIVTESEFKTLVKQSERTGVLAHQEGHFIRKVLTFKNTPARSLMIPRTQLMGLPEDSPITQAFEFLNRYALTRIPLYRGDLDHVTGILYTKDLVPVRMGSSSPASVNELLRKPLYVPETKTAKNLFRDMMNSRVHIAVVVDEQGVTTGIITIEDILQEMTGDAVERLRGPGSLIRMADSEKAVISGLLPLDSFNFHFGTELEHESFRTIGGLVMNAFGYIPDEGEKIAFSGFNFTARKVEGARIFELLVERERSDQDKEQTE